MHQSKPFIRLLMPLTLMSFIPQAHATDYAVGANIAVGVSHNDNIRLVKQNKTAVDKYTVSPILTFGATTETSEIKLDSSFDFNRYDESDYNSDDQDVQLNLSHQFEKSAAYLSAGYINNTTTTSETLTSGIIGTDAERAKQYQVAPRWVYSVNEINQVQIQASYVSQDYESNEYTGYKNIGAQADWMYKINERMTWIISPTYSDYQSEDLSVGIPFANAADVYVQSLGGYVNIPRAALGEQSYAVRTKNKGLNIGFDYEWSEQISVEARLGRTKNETTYPTKDPDNICGRLAANGITDERVVGFCNPIPSSEAFSSTADITWKWQNERHQISFGGAKRTQPTSNGYTVDATQLNSNWLYRLTELDRISLVLTLVRNRAIDDNSSLQNAANADRDYLSSAIAYQRQLDEQWFIRTSYQYSKQKYDQRDVEAASNVWTLSINYRPQQWHWSR